jgi:hypothetical protein
MHATCKLHMVLQLDDAMAAGLLLGYLLDRSSPES